MKAPEWWQPRGKTQIQIKWRDWYQTMTGQYVQRDVWILEYKGRRIGLAFTADGAQHLCNGFNMKDLDFSVVMGFNPNGNKKKQ